MLDLDSMARSASQQSIADSTKRRAILGYREGENHKGSLNNLFGGIKCMQMYGKFEGFPINSDSVLFGLVMNPVPLCHHFADMYLTSILLHASTTLSFFSASFS